jgi:signal transduction histidine kinase
VEVAVGSAKLSTFIRRNKGPILSEWESFARTLAQGSTMDVSGLRDHAQWMLDEIATDIDSPQSDDAESDKSKGLQQDSRRRLSGSVAAAKHGHDRAGSGFTVVEMMAEFRALRASVTRLWLAQSPQIGRDELDALIRFNEAMDEAIVYSLERYTRDIDETRQRFLAILSHDLRNPLGAIVAAASFLADVADLDPEHAKLVAMIESSATRMTHLIADMLELALNRMGDTMPVERDEMDVGELIDAVVTEVRASHDKARIEVSSHGDLTGRWDAARLAQAFTNLIGNAVQHGDGEPIRISALGDDRQVSIEVSNSGPDIPDERLRHIFDGTKPRDRRNGDRRHLGLGLFIVHKIVEGHGGSIDVRSSDGTTTFTIHLPRAA